MTARDDAWLDNLGLPGHAEILRRFLDEVERQPVFRFVELSCSVARGAGDELSDLDLGLGIADEQWPAALSIVPALLRRLGETVDLLEHVLAEWGDIPHRRFFVQYRDRVQVDLVAFPASRRSGMPPGSVALYDPDGRLMATMVSKLERATPEEVHEWVFLAWVALADLDKYVRRESPWEALERLHKARTYVWQLWAIAIEAPYPSFGLTSVLDQPASAGPPGLAETVATLESDDIRRAGLALADLLSTVSGAAAATTGAVLPMSLPRYVGELLRKPTRKTRP